MDDQTTTRKFEKRTLSGEQIEITIHELQPDDMRNSSVLLRYPSWQFNSGFDEMTSFSKTCGQNGEAPVSDSENSVTIVARVGSNIIASATIQGLRYSSGVRIGILRLNIPPAELIRGIGLTLFEAIEEAARLLRMDRIILELAERHDIYAIRTAIYAGFIESSQLPHRVRDKYGQMQDLVMLELPLQPDKPLNKTWKPLNKLAS